MKSKMPCLLSFRTQRVVAAFTLIELLVVIAIIALLAAIIFPVFSSAREKARQITCISNIRQLGLSVLMYVQDYDEVLPSITGGTQGEGIQGGWVYFDTFPYGPFDVTKGSVYPYVKSKGIYVCPSDGAGNHAGLSYAMSDCLSIVPDPFMGTAYGGTLASAANPSQLLLIGEEAESPGESRGSTNDGGLATNTDTISKRHQSGSCIVLLDGHARRLSVEQITAQKLRTGGEDKCPGK